MAITGRPSPRGVFDQGQTGGEAAGVARGLVDVADHQVVRTLVGGGPGLVDTVDRAPDPGGDRTEHRPGVARREVAGRQLHAVGVERADQVGAAVDEDRGLGGSGERHEPAGEGGELVGGGCAVPGVKRHGGAGSGDGGGPGGRNRPEQ